MSVIRVIRKRRRMTLRMLSEKTGLSISSISQIERGLVSPSIVSLRRICNALGISVGSVVSDERTADDNIVVKANQRKLIKDPQTHVVYELLCPDLRGKIEFLSIALPPGQSTSDEPLSHSGEEASLVQNGTVEFLVGDRVYVLEHGDSIYFHSDIPHKVRNVGSTEAIIFNCITPPDF